MEWDAERKQASKYIHGAGGKFCLNLGLTSKTASGTKVLSSSSEVNLVVCDLARMKSIVKMFKKWCERMCNPDQQKQAVRALKFDGTRTQVKATKMTIKTSKRHS